MLDLDYFPMSWKNTSFLLENILDLSFVLNIYFRSILSSRKIFYVFVSAVKYCKCFFPRHLILSYQNLPRCQRLNNHRVRGEGSATFDRMTVAGAVTSTERGRFLARVRNDGDGGSQGHFPRQRRVTL